MGVIKDLYVLISSASTIAVKGAQTLEKGAIALDNYASTWPERARKAGEEAAAASIAESERQLSELAKESGFSSVEELLEHQKKFMADLNKIFDK